MGAACCAPPEDKQQNSAPAHVVKAGLSDGMDLQETLETGDPYEDGKAEIVPASAVAIDEVVGVPVTEDVDPKPAVGVAPESAAPVKAVEPKRLELVVKRGNFASNGELLIISFTNHDQVKLGLTLDWQDKRTLEVKGVKEEGLISEWNSANPQKQVKEGDKIIEINGESGCPQAMLEHAATGKVTMVLLRPTSSPSSISEENLVVSFEHKQGCKLGIICDWGNKRTLLVEKVGPGEVASWNLANPDKRICPGDDIISIDGVSGDHDAMLKEAKKFGKEV